MNKRFNIIAIIVAIVGVLAIGWGVSASGAVQNVYPELQSDTRTAEEVDVRKQVRIIYPYCMHLGPAFLQERYKAIDEDFVTPWTDWETVRVLEYQRHPAFPACQG